MVGSLSQRGVTDCFSIGSCHCNATAEVFQLIGKNAGGSFPIHLRPHTVRQSTPPGLEDVAGCGCPYRLSAHLARRTDNCQSAPVRTSIDENSLGRLAAQCRYIGTGEAE